MKANKKMMFRRKLVYAAVISCFTVTPVFANPIGATVVNGQVGFAIQGNTLTVTNSPNAIINWQQFSINSGETTRFVQQSAQSAVLNRVVGQDPSQLLGSLLSNGRVYLINPNGILFGQGAVIDVGGLVASTLKLSDGDFLAGHLNFTDGVGAGSINNQGSITTPTGGSVYLIAPDITNSGVITSPQGEILLAAGHSVNLMDTTNPNVQVTVGAPDTQAVNIGSLIARSGKVGIYAALIDQQGLVDANTAVVGATGKITLKASKDIALEPGSVTTASGMAGGVKDGGEIRIVADGKLNVRQGSEVHVDGGADGGNGGFLELSGKAGFSLRGTYTGRAQKAGYHNGSLLLDPLNINIVAGGSHVMAGGSISAASGSASASFAIAPASLFGWGNVALAATNNIDVSSPISNGDISTGGSLTLTAGNNITISAPIGLSSTAGRFNHDLTLTAGNIVSINKSIYLGNNLLTLAAVGDVVIQPAAFGPAVVVDTLGELSVTGASLQVLGNTNASVTVNAHGGDASHNNTITVGSLTVQGGFASASASIDSSLPDNRVADATLHTDQNFVIHTTTGGVTVQGGHAFANASGNGHSATASTNAELSATGSLTIVSAGGLTVAGGDYNNSPSKALAQASGGASASANANALVKAGSMDITLAGQLGVNGGLSASAHAHGSNVNTATTHADAELSTTGILTIHNATGLFVQGGYNTKALASGSGANSANASTKATVKAGSMNITLSSGMRIAGGHGSSSSRIAAHAVGGGVNTATVTSNAIIAATGGDITISTASGNISGGSYNRALAAGSGTLTATVNGNAEFSATGTLNITTTGASGIMVEGGRWSTKASASGSGHNIANTTANALVKAASLNINTATNIQVLGGNATANVSGSGTNKAATAVSATISVDGSLDIGTGSNGSASLVKIQAGTANAYAYGSGITAPATPDSKADANATITAGSLILRANGLSIRGMTAHAQVGGSSTSAAFNRSATAEARALVSVGAVSELTLGSNGLFIAGSGCNASCTAIVNGAGGINSAFTDRSAFLRVAGDISSLTIGGGGISILAGSAHAIAGGSGTNIATENADAGIKVGGSIITGAPGIGFLTMRGSNARASGSGANNKATATANALITAGGNITLDIAGNMNLYGGSAYASDSGAIAQAVALIESGITQSGTMNVDVGGNVYITGGSGANNGNGLGAMAFAGIVNTGPINMTIRGGTGLTFDGGNGGATYNNWTVPGTGLSPDPTSAINITYTSGGVLSPDPTPNPNTSTWDSAFIMTRMSALPDPVIYAVDLGADTLNNANTFGAFIEPIRFGDSNEDKKNEKPVCR